MSEIKMPTSLLEELRMRKQAVKDAENLIESERIKYEEKTQTTKNFIERENCEIDAIRNIVVYVDLEKFVEELAKEWGVKTDNIVVDVKFFGTSRHGSKIPKEFFIKLHENGSSVKGKLCAHIVIDTKNKSHHLEINPILNLFDFQKDGRRLKDFLDVKSKALGVGYCVTDFVCPDYKNLIMRFSFNRLVNFSKCEFDSRITEMLYNSRIENGLQQVDDILRENINKQ